MSFKIWDIAGYFSIEREDFIRESSEFTIKVEKVGTLCNFDKILRIKRCISVPSAVVICFVAVNHSAITMANIKPAESIPNTRPHRTANADL